MTLSIYDKATFLPDTLKEDAQKYCSSEKNNFSPNTEESLLSDKFASMFFDSPQSKLKQSPGTKDLSRNSPFEKHDNKFCNQFTSKCSNVDWNTDVLDYFGDVKVQKSIHNKGTDSCSNFYLTHKSYSSSTKNAKAWGCDCNNSQHFSNSDVQSSFSLYQNESRSSVQLLETESLLKKTKSNLDDTIGYKSVRATYTKKKDRSHTISTPQTKLGKRTRVCKKIAKIATKITNFSNSSKPLLAEIEKLPPEHSYTKNNQLQTLFKMEYSSELSVESPNRQDETDLLQFSSYSQLGKLVARLNQAETSIFYPRQLSYFEHPYLVTTESNTRSFIRVETEAERKKIIAQHDRDQLNCIIKHNSSLKSTSAQTLTPTSSLSQSTDGIHGVHPSRTRQYFSNLKHALAGKLTFRKESSAETSAETQGPSNAKNVINITEKKEHSDANSHLKIDQWFSSNKPSKNNPTQSRKNASFVHPSVLRLFTSLGFFEFENKKRLPGKIADESELLGNTTLGSFPRLKHSVNTLVELSEQVLSQKICNQTETTMWSMFFWKLLLHFPQASYIYCKHCGDAIAANWDCIEFRKQLNDHNKQVCKQCQLAESQQKWAGKKEKKILFLSKCLY